MGNSVIGVGNYVIARPLPLGNFLIADTHLGENGVDTTIIMAKGHRQSIRTAARCTRPGLAAITTATELLDPPHRRA